MKKNLEKILKEFGFQPWTGTMSLCDYYVHLRINYKNWILESNKDEYISKYNDVRDKLISGISVKSVWKTGMDSGGKYFEEGEQLSFEDYDLYITRPLY
jgi:hypothetical protein